MPGSRDRSSSTTRSVGLLALTTALCFGLAACGEATESPSTASASPSESPSAEGREPQCADVWVADATIPKKYQGCSEGETWVRAEKTLCASGQVLVTYADRYYGAVGFKVNDVEGSLADSTSYQDAKARC